MVRPDHLTYSTLVSLWATQGRLDLAEEKLEAMQRSALEPTPATYAALLRGWLGRYAVAARGGGAGDPAAINEARTCAITRGQN